MLILDSDGNAVAQDDGAAGDEYASAADDERRQRTIRVAGVGATAGLLAGLVWGLGARLAMRILALAAARTPEFSLEGTVFILLVGLSLAMPLGLLYSAVRSYLPPARWARAAIAGGATLVVVGYPFYVGPLRDEAVLGHQQLALGLFFGLLVLLGVVIELAFAPLEHRLAGNARPLVTVVLVVPIALALMLGAMLIQLIIAAVTG